MPPVRLHWSLVAPVDRDAAWQVFRNTDAFNRAAGLGFAFEEVPQPDGSVLRFGRTSKFGLVIRWQEHPFEYLAPTGFRSRREFVGGPLATSVVTVQLEEVPHGTKVDYTVELTPRSLLTRPLVAADAQLTIKPTLGRVLRQTIDALSGGGAALDPVPAVSPQVAQRLEQLISAVEPAPLREVLRRRLVEGPYATLFRLQPLQLAHQTGVDPTIVARALLDATRAGLLELRWELLCPRCRGAKQSVEMLGSGDRVVHCLSCQIDYDGSFPDNVEVVFRPHPTLGHEPSPVDCLLSPHRTPHVLAQAVLEPGATVRWGLTLQEGGYRIDTGGSAATLEVTRGEAAQDLVLDIDEHGVQPRSTRIAPGKRYLFLRNCTDEPVVVGLHRQWRPPFALTAGRLLELDGVADMLPTGTIAPGYAPRVRAMSVLAAQALPGTAPGRLGTLTERAVHSHHGNDAVIACFATPADAIEALRHSARRGLAIGLASGPVVDLTDGEVHRLGGQTVDDALAAMRDAGAGRVALHARQRDDAAWAEALARAEAATESPGTFCHRYVRFPKEDHAERTAANQTLADAPLPRQVAGWVLGESLAEGGQGLLYEATRADGTQAAWKVVRPELATDTVACQRFRLEAHLVSQLDDDAVVKVFDHGQLPDGRPWLSMERLHGLDLADVLADGPLPADGVRQLAGRLCAGLDAAHDLGVLHRDVKPANVFLVDGDPARAKLVDFGIAQPLEEARLEDPDVILGTLEYMSPEQLQLDEVGPSSDVYAAGLVLYEALCQHLPWGGDLPIQVAMQRLTVPPQPLGDDVPDDLAQAIEKALAPSPQARFQRASELADSLTDKNRHAQTARGDTVR